ncbi:MAG: DNA polymerase III subunit alpha [Elusimicrobia bacterium]|nr:DNA polymerase III subunit alpha [Elusimicrobiota bacterium]
MPETGFVHLHNHSEYSLFDGLLRFTDNYGRPSGFMLELAGQKNPALALTDHGNMYGVPDFYFTAVKLGIKPLIGCEVCVQRTPIKDKSEGSHKGAGHLTLLAADSAGYSNLCRLVSRSFLEGFNHGPKTDLELLAAHSRGLICLSGCAAGQLPLLCSQGRSEEALGSAEKYAGIFGKNNFYLELMDNGLPAQAAAVKGLLEISKKLKLPVVATNNCHYWKPGDWEAHDAKLALNTRSLIDDARRFRFTGREYYFKSPEAMARLFAHAPAALRNTLAIAERCDVKLPAGKPRLPEFSVKGGADAHLKTLCSRGLADRIRRPGTEYKKRLEWELKTVKEAGLATCFLIAADLLKHLRAKGVAAGPGRGSAPGSLINYALGITGIDPLPAGLLFERFFSRESGCLPDADLEDGGREKALAYLRGKYGAESVTEIITFGRRSGRKLVWDLGAALGMSKEAISKLHRLLPKTGGSPEIPGLPGIKELCADPEIKKLAELADGLTGTKTNTGAYSAGVFIAPGAAADFVPLANCNRKRVVTTQYDGAALTKLGFMKIDLLNLRAIGINKAAAGRVKTRGFNLEKIPPDDVKAWTLVSHGLTTGIFQLESEELKKYLVQLQPGRLEDLAALVTLYRPGPIQSGLMDLFIERRKGRKDIVYPHPLLEPLLKETCGLFIYQEQVMSAAEKLAGFNPWEAKDFCRILGKKRQPELDEARELFIAGAKKRKTARKDAEAVFAQLAASGSYVFNKSHSLAHTLISYQQAWLKANYPQEFMTALLESEKPRDAEHSNYALYLAEARKIGVKI